MVPAISANAPKPLPPFVSQPQPVFFVLAVAAGAGAALPAAEPSGAAAADPENAPPPNFAWSGFASACASWT